MNHTIKAASHSEFLGLLSKAAASGSPLGRTSTPQGNENLWGIILAGGDGLRLKEYVRARFNSDCPKQYCVFTGSRSMIAHTIDRVSGLIERQRLLVSVNSAHGDFATRDLREIHARNVIVQPLNRDTGPGILLPLLHINARNPNACVAIFPSDQFILQEASFMQFINDAVHHVRRHPERIVLVGAEPSYAESDYGWIEPVQDGSTGDEEDIVGVKRFWEKPNNAKAAELFESGSLWNTMVIVVQVSALLRRFERLTPDLYRDFSVIGQSIGSPSAGEITREVYATIRPINFSVSLLASDVRDLFVMNARDIYWSDWGRADRIEEDLARTTRGNVIASHHMKSEFQLC